MSHTNIVSDLSHMLTDEFSRKSEWRIDAKDLAGKMPEIKYKYPSLIVPSIKSAVKKINSTTGLHVGLKVEKVQRGKTTLVFHKLRGERALVGKPRTTVEEEKSPAIKDPARKPWKSYKALFNDAFSLYHTTFVKVAKTDNLFLKWSALPEEEKDILMAELESKVWRHIIQDAQRHMNSLHPAERKDLEDKIAQMFSDYSSDKRIASIVAYLLSSE